MSVDDVLFAIIIGGVVLTGAYLRAQYALQRSRRAAARGADLRLSELCKSTGHPLPSHPEARFSSIESEGLLRQNSLRVHVRLAYRST